MLIDYFKAIFGKKCFIFYFVIGSLRPENFIWFYKTDFSYVKPLIVMTGSFKISNVILSIN